jgi:hypothetical protein
MVCQVAGHSNDATAAAVAKAASKLSLSAVPPAAPTQHTEAEAGPQLADKERLAAQIQLKQKVVKLLHKQKAEAAKARMQQQIDLKRQATAAGKAAAGQAAVGSSTGAQKLHVLHKQQHRQPLAGIAPVLASTPAELVSKAFRWKH